MAGPRPLLALLVAAAFALSGCVSADEPAAAPEPNGAASGTDEEGAAPAEDAPLGPPRWEVGDWWVYEDVQGAQNTFVVTGETAADWLIETDSEFYAFLDQAFGGTSTLGPQRKSDLAGSQDSDRVVFFKWPLRDGDTWTTPWDGLQRTIAVTETDDGFVFKATDPEGHVAVEYTFDAEAGWFGRFDFFAPNGALVFGNTLVTYGEGWEGDVVRMDVEQVLQHDSSQALAPNNLDAFTEEFQVRSDHTDVFVGTTALCASGAYHLKIRPTDPNADPEVGIDQTDACPVQGGFFSSLGHAAGTWRAELLTASPDTTQYSLILWLRTIETVPFG